MPQMPEQPEMLSIKELQIIKQNALNGFGIINPVTVLRLVNHIEQVESDLKERLQFDLLSELEEESNTDLFCPSLG